jgi:hypothetical protein
MFIPSVEIRSTIKVGRCSMSTKPRLQSCSNSQQTRVIRWPYIHLRYEFHQSHHKFASSFPCAFGNMIVSTAHCSSSFEVCSSFLFSHRWCTIKEKAVCSNPMRWQLSYTARLDHKAPKLARSRAVILSFLPICFFLLSVLFHGLSGCSEGQHPFDVQPRRSSVVERQGQSFRGAFGMRARLENLGVSHMRSGYTPRWTWVRDRCCGDRTTISLPQVQDIWAMLRGEITGDRRAEIKEALGVLQRAAKLGWIYSAFTLMFRSEELLTSILWFFFHAIQVGTRGSYACWLSTTTQRRG